DRGLVCCRFEAARHRFLSRRAAGDEAYAILRIARDDLEQHFIHGNDDAQNAIVKKKSFDDMLEDRLAAERAKLLRDLAAEARSRAGSRNDDDDLRVAHTAMMSCSL